jgi:hypothetical protein
MSGTDRPDEPPPGSPVPGQQNWSAPGGFERAQESRGGAGESPSGYGAVRTGQGEERKTADEATHTPRSEQPEGGDGDERR